MLAAVHLVRQALKYFTENASKDWEELSHTPQWQQRSTVPADRGPPQANHP